MKFEQYRRQTEPVHAGSLQIGGGAPVSVQSMTNTDSRDIPATLAQIRALESAGCELVRIACPDESACDAISAAKAEGIRVPLVADIHFDYRIALRAIRCGVDKIRINPGNIGAEERVAEVAHAAADAGIPIRIGVNGGSLEKSILAKYGHPTADALAESALYHAELLEKHAFSSIVLSIKSSSVRECLLANRKLASLCRYPIHLGVTEAGTAEQGILKNAMGIGALLAEGIGDTIRVSLTADPIEEVAAAKRILRAAGISDTGMQIVSCPTCGRTRYDLIGTVRAFEQAASEAGLLGLPCKVAIMGCAVNGPGEAREADIGVAGGVGEALLFCHGEPVRKIPEQDIVPQLIEEIRVRFGKE